MRKIITFCLVLVLAAMEGTAYDNKFEQAMTGAIQGLFESGDPEGVNQAIATFERIAQAEKERWEPAYYAALSYLWLSGMMQGNAKMDAWLDEAQKYHDMALARQAPEAELLVIQGYIHVMRLTVDPENRAAEYAPKSTALFQKALTVDTDNPRALLMLGSMELGSSQYFQNDTSEACETLRKAEAALNREEPANKLSPAWGKQLAKMFLQSCSN